ncbi:MAG TPA: cyclic nucleotide-binding domain-containing protein [Hyphomicrobiaceae bacterium]|nr:cyclic nucleotide-binding domain-containing protein [Hyphomicrobiaceae bacterium]
MSYVALDIFEQLKPEDAHWILASAELKTIEAGSLLVREDDPSDSIFFIADGLFEVYVFSDHTGPIKVGQLGPGEVVGEISWLDREPVSASVRAIETSSVIALPTALLDRKLGEDPAFAARLLRGVATMTAGRLRRTTAQVRRSEWAAGQRAATADAPDEGGVLAGIGELEALAAEAEWRAGDGKVSEADAARIGATFARLERAIGPQGVKLVTGLSDALQAELLPIVRRSRIGDRLYAKPRGYAADYQTIEMIYDGAPAGTGPLGPVIDASVLNLAAIKAIRNRRHLLAAEILSAYGAAAKEFHVASLACGPAREVFDVLEKAPDSSRLQLSCVDIDREALAHVEARCRRLGLAGRVHTFHGNLIYLATGRQELHLPQQDLIYSMSLIDYFSDEPATALIDWIHDRLRPGGRVILGSFHPRNPTRGLMDHVLDWHLTHRDEADMNRLLTGSKFGRPCSRILTEEEGVGLLAEARKA